VLILQSDMPAHRILPGSAVTLYLPLKVDGDSWNTIGYWSLFLQSFLKLTPDRIRWQISALGCKGIWGSVTQTLVKPTA